jgi:outer membrane protein OmpA-like peptidoglycan-associated protein
MMQNISCLPSRFVVLVIALATALAAAWMSFPQECFSQEVSRRVLANGDTLVRRATAGTWRFGGYAAGGVGAEIGFIAAPLFAGLPEERILRLQGYDIMNWQFGAVAEWNPPQSLWGAMLRLSYDGRAGIFAGATGGNPFKYATMSAAAILAHLVVAPSLRYAFPIANQRNIHVYAGGNAEILLASRIQPMLSFGGFRSPGTIDASAPPLGFTPPPVRFGFHLGVGFDVPIIHPRSKMEGGKMEERKMEEVGESYVQVQSQTQSRLQGILTPFVQVDYVIVTPEWNQATVRCGVAFKLALPEIEERTLPARSPFPLAADAPLFPTKPAAADVAASGSDKSQPILILPNEARTFLYAGQADVTPTPEMLKYLDAVVAYMKVRKQAVVRIAGHTEAVGSAADKRRIAEERASKALQYLVSKGIEQKRITAAGNADREPLGDNRSEAGRKQNRRLEVLVTE